MAVVAVWTPQGEIQLETSGFDPGAGLEIAPTLLANLRPLALAAARGVEAGIVRQGERWTALGNPLEAALIVLAPHGCARKRSLFRSQPAPEPAPT